MAGIPDDGARALLRNDPLTQGYKLFKTNCAVCHQFTKQAGDAFEEFPKGNPKASDLGDWGTETWVRGLLNDPSDPKFFGLTKLQGMIKWRKSVDKGRKKLNAAQIKDEDADFDTIAKAIAEQAVPPDKRDDDWRARFKKGIDAFKQQECNSCHTLGEEKDGVLAPVLNDWGTADWVRHTVMNPASTARYGGSNKMPAFRNKEGPGSEVLFKEFLDCNKDLDPGMILHLSDVDRELIVRFVGRDYRVVFGGQTIGAAPK
jgi:ubiquinol-cytochrome c reductase cytochrome b subunit